MTKSVELDTESQCKSLSLSGFIAGAREHGTISIELVAMKFSPCGGNRLMDVSAVMRARAEAEPLSLRSSSPNAPILKN